MNSVLKRRLALGAAGFVVLFGLFLGWRWLAWSGEAWLSERLGDVADVDWPGPDDTGPSRLTWIQPDIQFPSGQFTAERLELTFSPLSILLGQPQVTELTLDRPLWLGEADLSSAGLVQLVHLIDALGPHRVTARQATVAGDREWNDIEAAAERLGGSNRYHWQLSGHWIGDAHRVNLTAGAIVRARDNGLLLTEGSGQWIVTQGPWQGSWRTGLRSGTYADDLWSLEYLSWSGRWPEPGDTLPGELEWAGAIEQADQLDTGWRLAGLDTALTFLDDAEVPQRVSALSSGLTVRKDGLTGQLSLSYRSGGEDQNRDMTLAVEGQADLSPDRVQWQDPAILIGLTREDESLSLQFDAESLTFDPEQHQWRLSDGEWREQRPGQPQQSFGFGVLTGTWPGLTLTEAPAVAERLSDTLRPIGSQLEWTDALRRALVPKTGS